MASRGMVDHWPYLVPFATHDQIVLMIFMHTLQCFRWRMGTNAMIPLMPKEWLLLHLLYVEVTKRGGFEKVLREEAWRQVIATFSLHSPTRSISYMLRYTYINLLLHYEQLYFSRVQGPLFSRAAFWVQPDSTFPDSRYGVHTVTRTIEGTFDFMVNHGLEILQGGLYQLPPSITSPLSTVQPETVVAGSPLKQTKNRSQRDPYLPKSTRTGYHFFFVDKYSELKNLCPERVKEFRTVIAESWRKLSLSEKKVYYNKALKDKERYKREMEIYEEMKPVPKRRKLNSEVKKEDE